MCCVFLCVQRDIRELCDLNIRLPHAAAWIVRHSGSRPWHTSHVCGIVIARYSVQSTMVLGDGTRLLVSGEGAFSRASMAQAAVYNRLLLPSELCG